MTEFIVANASPFAIELMVFEEDTWMLMSADNVAIETRQSTGELLSGMDSQKRQQPGDLITRGSRWYAVINDIDDTEFDRQAAINASLESLYRELDRLGTRSFGIEAFRGIPDMQMLLAPSIPAAIERVWIKTRA